MDSLVYLVLVAPIFVTIGFACYTVLIQRYQLLAILTMVVTIFLGMWAIQSYYDAHEERPAKLIHFHDCMQTSNNSFRCRA